MRHPSASLRRLSGRLQALILAAGTLWAVSVTAGSQTAAGAWNALRASVPLRALRWELGDFFPQDTLSTAAVLTLSEAPVLLSARSAVAELWSKEPAETPETPEPQGENTPAPIQTTPIEETPLELPGNSTDNGIPARTLVPTDPSGYTVLGNVYLSNSTSYPVDESLLDSSFDAELTPETPQILILHTHGSEAYTPAGEPEVVWSGDHRTTDSRYNVVAVGDAMSEVFQQAGLSVLHDRTLYDYPSYAGAYDRSMSAIQSYLAQYPSLRFILDVHRDAIEDSNGQEYKVISAIDDVGTAAQMTLVVGSSGSGLPHERWRENLKLAIALQTDLLQQYPTLMRPLLLRNSRYNKNATTGSLLVEVGAAGNSPEEAALAGRLFAARMVEVLEARSK